MDVQVLLNSIDITNNLISYVRNNDICTGICTITIVTTNKINISINPYDIIDVYEESIKKGTYYVSSISQNIDNGTIEIEAQDGTKLLQDNFIETVYTLDGTTTTKYWIETYLNLTGINYIFDTTEEGNYLLENSTLGPGTAYEIIQPLLYKSGWYMYFDENNYCHIANLLADASNVSAIFDDNSIIKLSRTQNDSKLRNRAVVWGNGSESEGWIFAEELTYTPYNYDTNDKRTIVYSDSNIKTQLQAKLIAKQLLESFAYLDDTKTIELAGVYNIRTGNTVFVDSEYYNGIGLITSITVNMSSSGLITTVVLDERCPRLIAAFYGDVFISTWGNGIWKKSLYGNSWTDYSTGLEDLHIKDLFVWNGVLVCTANDGYTWYRTIADSSWTKFSHGILTTSTGSFSENETMAVACMIDKVSGNIYSLYNTKSMSNSKQTWVVIFNNQGKVLNYIWLETASSSNTLFGIDIERSGENTIISTASNYLYKIVKDLTKGNRKYYPHEVLDFEQKIMSIAPNIPANTTTNSYSAYRDCKYGYPAYGYISQFVVINDGYMYKDAIINGNTLYWKDRYGSKTFTLSFPSAPTSGSLITILDVDYSDSIKFRVFKASSTNGDWVLYYFDNLYEGVTKTGEIVASGNIYTGSTALSYTLYGPIFRMINGIVYVQWGGYTATSRIGYCLSIDMEDGSYSLAKPIDLADSSGYIWYPTTTYTTVGLPNGVGFCSPYLKYDSTSLQFSLNIVTYECRDAVCSEAKHFTFYTSQSNLNGYSYKGCYNFELGSGTEGIVIRGTMHGWERTFPCHLLYPTIDTYVFYTLAFGHSEGIFINHYYYYGTGYTADCVNNTYIPYYGEYGEWKEYCTTSFSTADRVLYSNKHKLIYLQTKYIMDIYGNKLGEISTITIDSNTFISPFIDDLDGSIYIFSTGGMYGFSREGNFVKYLKGPTGAFGNTFTYSGGFLIFTQKNGANGISGCNVLKLTDEVFLDKVWGYYVVRIEGNNKFNLVDFHWKPLRLENSRAFPLVSYTVDTDVFSGTPNKYVFPYTYSGFLFGADLVNIYSSTTLSGYSGVVVSGGITNSGIFGITKKVIFGDYDDVRIFDVYGSSITTAGEILNNYNGYRYFGAVSSSGQLKIGDINTISGYYDIYQELDPLSAYQPNSYFYDIGSGLMYNPPGLYTVFTMSGSKFRMETTNSYDIPFLFASETTQSGNNFHQRDSNSDIFTERNVNLPGSEITMIRADDII
jgi:hypothetical protein